MKRFTNNIVSIKRGDADIDKVYKGAVQIFPDEPVGPKFALQFNGTTGRVDLGPTFGFIVDNRISWTLIMTFLTFDVSKVQEMFSFFGTGDAALNIRNGKLGYNHYVSGPDANPDSVEVTTNLVNNVIYTGAVVRDNSVGTKIFLDGNFEGINTLIRNASTVGLRTDSIGAAITNFSQAGRNFTNGIIYDVKIYNQVLTDQEVSDVSNNIPITKTPFAHWDFQDGSGTVLTDIIGNGVNSAGNVQSNNGNILGGATWIEV
jgi:hypothetical protein